MTALARFILKAPGAYRVSLFQPQNDEGSEFGQGMSIPPIIVNVNLDSGALSRTGQNRGRGILLDETATVCIGCEGFNPVVIAPETDGTVREAYRAENTNRFWTWLADHHAT